MLVIITRLGGPATKALPTGLTAVAPDLPAFALGTRMRGCYSFGHRIWL